MRYDKESASFVMGIAEAKEITRQLGCVDRYMEKISATSADTAPCDHQLKAIGPFTAFVHDCKWCQLRSDAGAAHRLIEGLGQAFEKAKGAREADRKNWDGFARS